MSDEATTETESGSALLTARSKIVEAEERIDMYALKAFYKERKIKCFLCAAAEIETFEEGAKLHGFDLDDHLNALNKLAAEKPAGEVQFMGMWQRLGRWFLKIAQDKPSE